MKSMMKRELKDSVKRYPKHCVVHIRNRVSVARHNLRRLSGTCLGFG